MLDFMRFDTDESRGSLLNRARKVVLSALQRYDLEWESIRFIQLSDTITYKIEVSGAESYLLRIHSDRLSREEIISELAFLQALNKAADLTVPEGLASLDGSVVLEIETEDGYKRPFVTMMRWIEGEHASEDFSDSAVFNMGVLMGKLHEAATDFIPPPNFTRTTWGADSFSRGITKLEQYYTCFLTDEAWKAYQAAAEKIQSELAGMQQNEDNYGLIHGDLHTGNIVYNNEQPYPIDFGRCGYGYYLYDMAGSLLALWPKHRWLLIQGYESVRKLETNYARKLELFFIMVMIENYVHHCSDPRETANIIGEQPYAQAYIKKYLNDTPFLFDVIEPIELDSTTEVD